MCDLDQYSVIQSFIFVFETVRCCHDVVSVLSRCCLGVVLVLSRYCLGMARYWFRVQVDHSGCLMWFNWRYSILDRVDDGHLPASRHGGCWWLEGWQCAKWAGLIGGFSGEINDEHWSVIVGRRERGLSAHPRTLKANSTSLYKRKKEEVFVFIGILTRGWLWEKKEKKKKKKKGKKGKKGKEKEGRGGDRKELMELNAMVLELTCGKTREWIEVSAWSLKCETDQSESKLMSERKAKEWQRFISVFSSVLIGLVAAVCNWLNGSAILFWGRGEEGKRGREEGREGAYRMKVWRQSIWTHWWIINILVFWLQTRVVMTVIVPSQQVSHTST